MIAGCTGWWTDREIIVLPALQDMITPTLQVVQVTYKGNSKTSDKDVLWNNWSMMVQLVAPAEGICNQHMSSVYVINICHHLCHQVQRTHVRKMRTNLRTNRLQLR